MRFLMQVTIPVEAGNAAAKNGTLSTTIQEVLSELKPEAAYFAEVNGERTGFIVFDLKETSQIPAVAEPFFLAFNAKIQFHPAMTPADLAAASPAIEKAVKRWGG